MLTDVNWKSVYRSGDDNLLEDFYKPILGNAISYDRAVGFFSSELFSANLKGLSSLVANEGKMRLVIGHPLSELEFKAIQHGNELARTLDKLNEKLLELITEAKSQSIDRLELLAWLIASDRLTIKYALRRQGMYHEKIGVIKDKDGNTVVFQGSANETLYAMSDQYNAESIMVFPSWKQDVFSEYGKPCVDGFENLWEGKQPNTLTIDVPSHFYSKISEQYDLVGKSEPTIEEDENKYHKQFFSDLLFDINPKVPDQLKGKDFSLFKHQVDAINTWWSANNRKGILKLATGSGKTITSIFAATKIFEARRSKKQGLCFIVAVPYIELAEQWVGDLNQFNIFPHRCFGSKSSWDAHLDKDIFSFRMKAIDFLAIIVVNKTLSTDNFKSKVAQILPEQIMFIGDECHNHGSKRMQDYLPEADFRMGLSATPYRSDDDEFDSPFPDEAKGRLNSYYMGVVCEYSLSDAINDGVLCEYNYYIIPAHLTSEEQENYDTLSENISKILARRRSTGISKNDQEQLTRLCSQRSRLLGTASNKLVELDKLTKLVDHDKRSLSLFYCGEGRVFNADEVGDDQKVVEKVTEVLAANNWKTSRFTSEELGADRKEIMKSFRSKEIDALVSMKVLDEGIDVPNCNTAYILASTKNPRQYIQRRGRVLRKSPGKQVAEIYDFVVLPNGNADTRYSERLKKSELERIDEFTALANNKYQIENVVDGLELRDE